MKKEIPDLVSLLTLLQKTQVSPTCSKQEDQNDFSHGMSGCNNASSLFSFLIQTLQKDGAIVFFPNPQNMGTLSLRLGEYQLTKELRLLYASFMKQKFFHLYHATAMLRSLAQVGEFLLAYKIYNRMIIKLAPSRKLQDTMIIVATQHHDLETAYKAFLYAVEKKVADSETYVHMIGAAGTCSNLKLAYKIYIQAQSQEFSPLGKTGIHNAMIAAAGLNGCSKLAYQIYLQIQQKEFSNSRKALLSMIDTATDMTFAYELLQKYQAQNPIVADPYISVINVASKHRDLNICYAAFTEAKKYLRFNSKTFVYNPMIAAALKCNDVVFAYRIFFEAKQLQITNAATYNLLIDACFKAQDEVSARVLFSESLSFWKPEHSQATRYHFQGFSYGTAYLAFDELLSNSKQDGEFEIVCGSEFKQVNKGILACLESHNNHFNFKVDSYNNVGGLCIQYQRKTLENTTEISSCSSDSIVKQTPSTFEKQTNTRVNPQVNRFFSPTKINFSKHDYAKDLAKNPRLATDWLKQYGNFRNNLDGLDLAETSYSWQ